MIPFKKQFSLLMLLALNCQAMPQYDYSAYDEDEYGDTIQPFEGPPVGTCNLPADLGGTGKKIYTVRTVNQDTYRELILFLLVLGRIIIL